MDAERLARAMHNGWEGEPCPDPNCPDIDRWRADARNLIREYDSLAAPAVTETDLLREVFNAADAFVDELDAPPGHPLSDHYRSQNEARLRAALDAARAALDAPAVTETDLRAALDVERLALALDAPGVFEDPLDDPVGLARDIAREYAALAGTSDTEEGQGS